MKCTQGVVIAAVLSSVVFVGCGKGPAGPVNAVVLKTSQGEMVMELLPNLAPNAVDALRRLVAAGAYDGIAFSSYEKQGSLTIAAPQSDATTGIHTLVDTEATSRPHAYGTVGFVPGEENNGSLYIALESNEEWDSKRVVVGQIVAGSGVLDKLRKGDTIQGTTPTQTSSYDKVAVMGTTQGTIVFEFYPESALHAVDNFKKLASQKYYDGLTFHRYVQGFVVQGGDPSGDGTGGPGYTIPDEYRNPLQRPHELGTVAMARTSMPNSAGSQFYFCLDKLASLDGQYTTFGQIIDGLDVMKELRQGDEIIRVSLKDRSKYVPQE